MFKRWISIIKRTLGSISYFNVHTNSDNVSPITSTSLVGGKNITLSLISIQYRINYVFLFYLLYFCICCNHWNSKHVGRISVRQLIPCPVLHIIQQIVTHLWELILYAIIWSGIDFQSFCYWFTIRESKLHYTKDFQNL